MGKFLDDLGKFVNDVIAVPAKGERSDIWDALNFATTQNEENPLNLDGYQPISDASLENFASNRKLPYDDLAGIIQKRNSSFNIIDIAPNLLLSKDYDCSIPKNTLLDKVGYESEETAVGLPAFDLGTWRTVALPIAGSFFRFKFLPGKINNAANGLTSNRNTTNKPADYYPGNMPVTQAVVASEIYYSRMVLVQFDDPNGPLHLVEDGDTFDFTFQTVYVSFKRYCPRFSVTLGYNSTIVQAGETRQLNSNIHAGGGLGMWGNSIRHCSPFCITNAGNQSPPSQTSVTAGNFNNITLFTNGFPGGNLLGVATGWITNITISGWANAGSTILAYVNLYVEGNGAVQDKMVASFPLQASTLTSEVSVSWSPSIPQRFTLVGETNEILVMRVGVTSGAALNYSWSVTGYVYGAIANPNNGSPYTLDHLTTAPFPQDYLQTINRI